MTKQDKLTLMAAAEALNTTIDEVKRMTKRDQLDAVFEDGEAYVGRWSVMEFMGEQYEESDDSGAILIAKAEAAAILGISEASVYGYGNAGKIKKVGDYYDKESVLRYKANRDNGAASNKGGLRTAKAQAIPKDKNTINNEKIVNDEGNKINDEDSLMGGYMSTREAYERFASYERTYSHDHINLIKENSYLKGKLDVLERLCPALNRGASNDSIV